jgi:hypothetical protein
MLEYSANDGCYRCIQSSVLTPFFLSIIVQQLACLVATVAAHELLQVASTATKMKPGNTHLYRRIVDVRHYPTGDSKKGGDTGELQSQELSKRRPSAGFQAM